ncbi:RHS repeat-associated core domain-containing protein, partial [Sulfuricurvum sp.]|uniref:RHS repeat-associated core domain-containing protein n=1 Tax=Sulfuricurvum sp. TaxID=2025608 RepID=UPI00262A9959
MIGWDDRREYRYDPSGNDISHPLRRYDDTNHRLISDERYRYTYGSNGELLSKRSDTEEILYTYDERYRLIRVVYGVIEQSSHAPAYSSKLSISSALSTPSTRHTQTFSFEYDPLGRRISKHFRSESQEYHHRYLYDGESIVAIYDGEDERLLATLIHDRSVDTPLSITTYEREDETLKSELTMEDYQIYQQTLRHTYYYHRDHQNSIIALTCQEGKIVERYDYDPFGNITLEEHTEGIQTLNPYRYTGREYDAPDLYYYRARYYDPTIGRFITSDPIGYLSGDFNFYRYVGNDPVNFIDPLGLAKQKGNCTTASDKLDKAKKELTKKLEKLNRFKKIAAKKAAKKLATLPLKAVPILGWAMAAYDVYDVVTTGMDIADMVKDYDNAADAVEAAASELDV